MADTDPPVNDRAIRIYFMSTMVYLVLAIITLSGILYSVTSSMESVNKNATLISNNRKGDDILMSLKNSVTVNSEFDIIIPSPEKNDYGNPVVPSWVYSDTQNSYGNDFIYCPFLASNNKTQSKTTESYNSINNTYTIDSYVEASMADRSYAVSASKNLYVDGDQVIFAIANKNENNNNISCDDIKVDGKKLRLKNGKVWFYTKKAFMSKSSYSSSNVTLFVSSDESQMRNGNMSGLDRYNPTSIVGAMNNLISGKYDKIRIKMFDGEYSVPQSLSVIRDTFDGDDLVGASILFEPVSGGSSDENTEPEHDHGVVIDFGSGVLKANDVSVTFNGVSVKSDIVMSGGGLLANNASLGNVFLDGANISKLSGVVLDSLSLNNTDITVGGWVDINKGLTASASDVFLGVVEGNGSAIVNIGVKSDAYLSFVNGSKLLINNTDLTIYPRIVSNELIYLSDSEMSVYNSDIKIDNTKQQFPSLIVSIILTNDDLSIRRSSIVMNEGNADSGIRLLGGASLYMHESGLFTMGKVPHVPIVDSGAVGVSGIDTIVKKSITSGFCWKGIIFKDSDQLSSLPKSETGDAADFDYLYNRRFNLSNWKCN